MALTDLIFVGRLGPQPLSVISISNVCWTLIFYVLMGCLSALDTLGSQALGSGDAKSSCSSSLSLS